MTPTTTAVEARIARAYKQMEAGDLDGLLTLYLPDAIIQGAGQPPVAGTAALREFWRTTFDAYRVRATPEILEAIAFGNVVVVRGRAVGELAPTDGGAPVVLDTWFLQVYRVQPDGSVLFWRGANGPNPPAA
jgi:ketosteroid isomerase-like protein